MMIRQINALFVAILNFTHVR